MRDRAGLVWCGVVLLGLGVVGCGEGSGKKTVDGGADAGGGDAGGSDSTAVVGYWTGDWGDLVLRQVGDEMWGAYTHDDGTVRGVYANGVFDGWWTEVPSRMPTIDAGDVQFTFVFDASGVATSIDGRWRYGDATNEPDWREDWDLSLHSGDPEPEALAARFDDPTLFIAHP